MTFSTQCQAQINTPGLLAELIISGLASCSPEGCPKLCLAQSCIYSSRQCQELLEIEKRYFGEPSLPWFAFPVSVVWGYISPIGPQSHSWLCACSGWGQAEQTALCRVARRCPFCNTLKHPCKVTKFTS